MKEGAAYAQETRKTILTMQKVSKSAPNGKVLLKNVSLGIYLGAKIGILGANGAGKSTLMKLVRRREHGCASAQPPAPLAGAGFRPRSASSMRNYPTQPPVRPQLAKVDAAYEGDLVVQDGLRIGYLPQEPALDAGLTVADNIAPGVAPMRAMLADFDAVSAAMGEPGADLEALMGKMERLQSAIDAANGWELDRQVGDRDAGVQVCVLVFINPEP